jgi:hypothetical protein
MNVFYKVPQVHKDAFVAPSASLTGDIEVGQGCSIWYGCVLRGMAFDLCTLFWPELLASICLHDATSTIANCGHLYQQKPYNYSFSGRFGFCVLSYDMYFCVF